MMQIYLVHPTHGKKIAVSLADRDNDIKSGWKAVTEDVFYPKTAAKPEPIPDATRDDLVAKYTEKHGKPPHHRMTDATIEASLND